MSDFDRNAKPAEGSQTKKMIMVGVLGAVLLGVLAMQMTKNGPAQAAAAPDPGDAAVSAAPGADENPELLRAALTQDPTKTLLIGERALANATPLRNPFGMSTGWRRSITREVTIAVGPGPVQPDIKLPDVPTPPRLVPVVPQLKAADFKLNMIQFKGANSIALINGKILTAGQVINDAVVVEIQENAVVLRHKDVADGQKLELQLQPK